MTTMIWSNLPNWVPPAVRHKAKELVCQLQKENEPKALKVLHRLVFDSRMQRVWRELYRKRRVGHKSTELFMYPARGHLPVDSPWTQRDAAVIYLFEHAHALALEDSKLLTLSEARTLAATLQKTARNLRKEADTIRFIEDADTILGEYGAMELERLATACDHEAHSILSLVPSLVSQRHSGDERLRAYVAWLARTTRLMFNTPMYTTLATITNVALDRMDVTDERVKEILEVSGG